MHSGGVFLAPLAPALFDGPRNPFLPRRPGAGILVFGHYPPGSRSGKPAPWAVYCGVKTPIHLGNHGADLYPAPPHLCDEKPAVGRTHHRHLFEKSGHDRRISRPRRQPAPHQQRPLSKRPQPEPQRHRASPKQPVLFGPSRTHHGHPRPTNRHFPRGHAYPHRPNHPIPPGGGPIGPASAITRHSRGPEFGSLLAQEHLFENPGNDSCGIFTPHIPRPSPGNYPTAP